MKKKASVLGLLLFVVFGAFFLWKLVGTVDAIEPNHGKNPFVDVSDTDWFFEDVCYVYENGLMSGTGDTEFSPQQETTRAMIVTILHRMEGKPETATACTFSDVSPDSYYYTAVTWAVEKGIVNGYSAASFAPDDSVTREQLAAILYRYAQYKGYDVRVDSAESLLSFRDRGEISPYAVDAVTWAVSVGLLNGMDKDTLSPSGSATRAQIAAIMHRLCVNLAGTEEQTAEPEDKSETKAENETKKAKSEDRVEDTAEESEPGHSETSQPEEAQTISDAPAFVVEEVSAHPGDQEVAVNISVQNNPGIASIGMYVTYDPALTLEKIVYNDEIGGQTMQPKTLDTPAKLTWLSPFQDVEGDWVFVTLHFSIPQNTASGIYPICLSYDAEDVFDLTEKNIQFDTIHGSVTIQK